MAIVRVLKNENIYNVPGADSKAYRVMVDKECLLTLRVGAESLLDIPVGKHVVYFQEAKLAGLKSNKLNIDVKSLDENLILECIPNSVNEAIASMSYGQVEMVTVVCHCGATNSVPKGKSRVCEYCRAPLILPAENENPTNREEPQFSQTYQQPQQQPQYNAPKQKVKKPFNKRKTFIIVAVIIVLAIIGSFLPDDETKAPESNPVVDPSSSVEEEVADAEKEIRQFSYNKVAEGSFEMASKECSYSYIYYVVDTMEELSKEEVQNIMREIYFSEAKQIEGFENYGLYLWNSDEKAKNSNLKNEDDYKSLNGKKETLPGQLDFLSYNDPSGLQTLDFYYYGSRFSSDHSFYYEFFDGEFIEKIIP